MQAEQSFDQPSQPPKDFIQKCSSNNPIQKICTNKLCQNESLHCGSNTCKQCLADHVSCQYVSCMSFTHLISENEQMHRQFVEKILIREKEMIDSLLNQRSKLLKRISLKEFNLDSKHQSTLTQIYACHENGIVKGKDAFELHLALLNKNQQDEIQQTDLLNKYKEQTKQIILQYISTRDKLMDDFVDVKADNIHEILSSTIIDTKDKIDFLIDQLGKPAKIDLIFRASEHSFRSKYFHDYCDNIPNTLVVLKTEFGKTIGAFTPIIWNQQEGFVKDQQKRSFLLSFDLKKKMSLINPDKAVCCNECSGPRFGGGWDLYISDKCDRSKSSFTNFPSSYNHNGEYQQNQKTWLSFCGAPNGYYFNIVEYEVFRVEWSQ